MWKDEAWLLDMLQACRKALQDAESLDERRFHVSSLHRRSRAFGMLPCIPISAWT